MMERAILAQHGRKLDNNKQHHRKVVNDYKGFFTPVSQLLLIEFHKYETPVTLE
jgi:hypothetical protein